jgi:pimeloyl-ACP methyl ester carboxylesterase
MSRAPGTGLNYARHGSGESVLLLHGIGGDLCVWEPVLEPLARERDVIAVDLPGFGQSPALPEAVAPTPSALAEAVSRFLDELGLDRVHVVGNSLGGWLALEMARSGRARTVVGLCPAGLWEAPLLPAGVRARGRAHRVLRELSPALPLVLRSRRVRRLALAPFVADPDKVPYGAALRMARSYARATAYGATNTAMRQGYFHDAEEITAPILLAFGEYDRLVRPVKLAVPGAQTVILPGCGHIPMWDDPRLVSRLILQGTDSARLTSAGALS